MKFLYLTTICVLTSFSLDAQTLTQNNHAPAPGDPRQLYQCDSTNVMPGASGAGASWNFTSVVSHTNLLKTYTTNPTSSATYSPADVIQFSSGTDAAYYKSTATDLKYQGGAISVSTLVANLVYSPSSGAIRGSYPMSLNTTGTSTIAGTIAFTISSVPISANFTGNSKVIADGTGTLSLPGGAAGVFTNVIRVVTSQTLNFTVQFPPATGTLTQIHYDYYSVGVKAPLLSIQTSTIISPAGSPTQSLVYMQKDYMDPSLGINEKKATSIDLSVYPNPASSVINLTTESTQAKDAFIYDVTGKLVDKQSFADGKLKLDVTAYSNGLYIYKVTNASGQNLKTGKLTVTH